MPNANSFCSFFSAMMVLWIAGRSVRLSAYCPISDHCMKELPALPHDIAMSRLDKNVMNIIQHIHEFFPGHSSSWSWVISIMFPGKICLGYCPVDTWVTMIIFPEYRVSASLVITVIFPFMLKDRNTRDRLWTIFKRTMCLILGYKSRWKWYLCHLYLVPCQLANQRGSHMPDNNSRICGRPTSYDDLWGVSSKTCLFSCFKVDGIFQFPSISSQLAKNKKKSHFQLAKNKSLGRR